MIAHPVRMIPQDTLQQITGRFEFVGAAECGAVSRRDCGIDAGIRNAETGGRADSGLSNSALGYG